MPEMPELEETDLGDGLLADAAEWVVDTGKEAAADAIDWILEQVQEVIDLAKAEAVAMLDEIEADLDYWTEWFETLGVVIDERIVHCQQTIDEFSSKLAECQDVEGIFDLLLQTMTEEFTGVAVGIDDLEQLWQSLVAAFDDGLGWVEATVTPYA